MWSFHLKQEMLISWSNVEMKAYREWQNENCSHTKVEAKKIFALLKKKTDKKIFHKWDFYAETCWKQKIFHKLIAVQREASSRSTSKTSWLKGEKWDEQETTFNASIMPFVYESFL